MCIFSSKDCPSARWSQHLFCRHSDNTTTKNQKRSSWGLHLQPPVFSSIFSVGSPGVLTNPALATGGTARCSFFQLSWSETGHQDIVPTRHRGIVTARCQHWADALFRLTPSNSQVCSFEQKDRLTDLPILNCSDQSCCVVRSADNNNIGSEFRSILMQAAQMG